MQWHCFSVHIGCAVTLLLAVQWYYVFWFCCDIVVAVQWYYVFWFCSDTVVAVLWHFTLVVQWYCLLWLCSADALEKNQQLEFERNKERFAFLKVSTRVCLVLHACKRLPPPPTPLMSYGLSQSMRDILLNWPKIEVPCTTGDVCLGPFQMCQVIVGHKI